MCLSAAMTSLVNLTATETVSPTWRWCGSSPHGWKFFLGLLLNQYLIEDLKYLPQSQENWSSWKQDPLIYFDCLANLFSFRFATATVFFLTNLQQTQHSDGNQAARRVNRHGITGRRKVDAWLHLLLRRTTGVSHQPPLRCLTENTCSVIAKVKLKLKSKQMIVAVCGL